MDIEQQVLAAFQVEHKEHLSRIRALLAELADEGSADRQGNLDEAFRMAHSLKGGARVCDLRPAETLGHGLETVFSRLRDRQLACDEAVMQQISIVLDGIEDWMAALAQTNTPPEPQEAEEAIERLRQFGGHSGGPTSQQPAAREEPARGTAPLDQPIATVRVCVESLDRLLQSSGRLVAESLRQDQVTRELGELRQTIETMVRQRDAMRGAVRGILHHFGSRPDLQQMARCIESLDRQVHVLAQNVRQLYLRQQRSTWLLQSCGRQIQSDLRQASMVSAESLFQGFAKMVRDLARDEGKQVEFKFVGADVRADRLVLQALKDPVMHMLRNAVTHGMELPDERSAQGKPPTGRVQLTVSSVGNQLTITVDDDGRGIDLPRVAEVARRRRPGSLPDVLQEPAQLNRMIFEPGFSTYATVNELAGRGMGLSVVHEASKRLQGDVQLVQRPGPGAMLRLSVPVSICTRRLLLVATGDQTFAVPLSAARRLLRVPRSEVQSLEGKPFILYQKEPIPLVSLAALLGIDAAPQAAAGPLVCVMILQLGAQRLAVGVAAFLAERDLLVQQLDAQASRSEFSGVILLDDGRPALVINPAQLLERAHRAANLQGTSEAVPQTARLRLPCVLVVDDSFTTRTLEKSILETHGYQVDVAMDGVEALSKLKCGDYDLVITDIEMPRLDGFGLLEEMKKQPKLAAVPVILVTSRDRVEDQQHGLQLGAEAYIVKRKFDHQDLLSAIERVL